MRRIPPALAALALALALPGLARAADDETATLWTKQCKSCHGLDGKAETDMGRKHKTPDMTTDKWQSNPRHTDAWIKDVISNGIPNTKMKGYVKDGKITEAQADALVKHVRSLKAPKAP